MFTNIQITFAGKNYVLNYDPKSEPAESSYKWLDIAGNRVVDRTIIRILTKRFLERNDLSIEQLSDAERTRHERIVSSMKQVVHWYSRQWNLGIIGWSDNCDTSGIRCFDCGEISDDFYPDGRCAVCHERFVGNSRHRNSFSGRTNRQLAARGHFKSR